MVSMVTSVGGATQPSRNEAYLSINLTVLFLTCWSSSSLPLCWVSFSMSPLESWVRSWMPWGVTPSNQHPSSFVLTARDTALWRGRGRGGGAGAEGGRVRQMMYSQIMLRQCSISMSIVTRNDPTSDIWSPFVFFSNQNTFLWSIFHMIMTISIIMGISIRWEGKP